MSKKLLEMNKEELQEHLNSHPITLRLLYSKNYINKVNWDYVPIAFVRKYNNLINWRLVSCYKCLSEKFITKHKNLINWGCISVYQELSEAFIEKYADKVSWFNISKYQKLSEEFIERHADEVDWWNICTYQKLSEEFIERNKDKVKWTRISAYQKLSETFIKKHADKVYWLYISLCQKISEEFIFTNENRLDMEAVKDNWLNKSTDYKKQEIINTGLYECYDDYFIAYKGIRSDRYSNFNFQFQYLPGETYTRFADGSAEEGSFGLSAWTKEGAEGYCGELVVKVKIYYEDVARVVHNGGKIRCSKMTVLN